MQFLLIAYDSTDTDALERRMEGVWEKIEIQPFRLANPE